MDILRGGIVPGSLDDDESDVIDAEVLHEDEIVWEDDGDRPGARRRLPLLPRQAPRATRAQIGA
jgi:hypothetical protein